MAIVNGTFGSDSLIGTAGDDTINPFDNNFGNDRIRATTGNDEIIFSSGSNGFFSVFYDLLSSGVVATITGQDGTVAKPNGETDTLTDVRNAITADGFFFGGSTFNDTLNLTLDGGWFAVEGGPGVDSFNITMTGGTLRFDFNWSNQGVVIDADLGSNQIINDGWGNTESVNANITGGRVEIQGTDFADTILGSEEGDRFILRGGNDSLDGRDGFDTLRYDRNGVDAVTVNLQTGVATGTWDGNAFTHSIANIEEVWGSRNDGDTLIGDNNSNWFEGRGGNDTLFGGGGEDWLFGEEGDDVLYGGAGRNNIYGGAGNDYIDASLTDPNGFGDWIDPGTGSNTIIGSSALWANFDGIDLSYKNVFGTGGITLTVGANGTGTTVSTNAGVVNDTFTYAHNFQGTDGNDTLIGSNEDRWEGWNGFEGSDSIDGGGGYDELQNYTRNNSDVTPQGVFVSFASGIAVDIYGDTDQIANIEAVRGTDLGDTFVGNSAQDFISYRGLEGGDTIFGSDSFDRIDYSRDADEGGSAGITANLNTGNVYDGFGDLDKVSKIDGIRGTNFDDLIFGTGADEVYDVRDGNDTVYGGLGNDHLNDGAGDDAMYGGGGNDTLYAGSGADTFFGGSGVDDVFVDVSFLDPKLFTVLFDMRDGTHGALESTFNRDVYSDVENYTLEGDWNALITGNDAANNIHLEFGDDTVYGGLGNDVIASGEGNDIQNGGAGDDVLSGEEGNDQLFGTSGNDTLDGAAGDDTLSGGSDNDTLSGGTGEDLVLGGAGMDLLSGDADNDILSAGGNNDSLNGGSGDDMVLGGGGDDNGLGADGNDTLSGGGGNDSMSGGNDDDQVFGAAGDDGLLGGSGNDILSGGNGFDQAFGGGGNDTVFGGAQDDVLFGGADIDALYGGTGNDTVYAGTGDDQVFGAAGNDLLDGGGGNDTLFGGIGEDDFRFAAGNDTISGYENDTDELMLSTALWNNANLTVTQILATYAVQTSPGIVDFTFDNGDTLRLINGSGVDLGSLSDEIMIF